jgi:arabinogalactan endo-1,4-beta-galactosidase
MRVQADITTGLLQEQGDAIYRVGGDALCLEDVILRLGIDTVRIAFFSGESPVLHLDRSFRALERLAALGLDAYLCLHCSDSWADPSHQAIPRGWNVADGYELRDVFASYLIGIVKRVAAVGARVRYIQIGNEVTNGLLWPFGRDWDSFADLCSVAGAIVRDYLPHAKLVLHTDLGGGGENAARWYAEVRRRRLPFDVIGLSYYPVWHGDLEFLHATLHGLADVMDRPILIAETGYMNTAAKTSAWFGDWTAQGLPYSEAGQRRFLAYLREIVDASPALVEREVFWWGAFAHRTREHFPVSWFDGTGRALGVTEDVARAR